MINCHDGETFFFSASTGCQTDANIATYCCHVPGIVLADESTVFGDDNGRVMLSELVVDCEAVDASDNNACRELVK